MNFLGSQTRFRTRISCRAGVGRLASSDGGDLALWGVLVNVPRGLRFPPAAASFQGYAGKPDTPANLDERLLSDMVRMLRARPGDRCLSEFACTAASGQFPNHVQSDPAPWGWLLPFPAMQGPALPSQCLAASGQQSLSTVAGNSQQSTINSCPRSSQATVEAKPRETASRRMAAFGLARSGKACSGKACRGTACCGMPWSGIACSGIACS